jgi:hypothetical protein
MFVTVGQFNPNLIFVELYQAPPRGKKALYNFFKCSRLVCLLLLAT